MPKNVVICLDGTGNEFGDKNSNVVKFYRCLTNVPGQQVAYYHPGLGTMGAPNALGKIAQWWTKQLGLATGFGFTNTLVDAYTFLMNNYETGDQLYLFGFSRGAYLARSLASLLYMFGLLRQGNDILIRYAIRMLKKKPTKETWRQADEFKKTFARDCPIHFVGVWDTVSSIGWMTIWRGYHLPHTAKNPSIKIGRHAMSIDERRAFFRPNHWGPPDHGQDLKEVWFAGVHSDIGGGYAEAQSGLAKITLAWMFDHAQEAGALIDLAESAAILGGDPAYVAPSPTGPMHNSLREWWLFLEILPRRFYDTRKVPATWRWKLPLAQVRYLAPRANVHRSVVARQRGNVDYAPPNLPADPTVV